MEREYFAQHISGQIWALLRTECEYIAHHIPGPIRAPHSLDAAEEALGRLLEALNGLRGWMTCSRNSQSAQLRKQKSRNSRSTRRTSSEAHDACMTRQRRARGLVRSGAIGLLITMEYSRVGSSTWLCPTSFGSNQIGVELVDGLGN